MKKLVDFKMMLMAFGLFAEMVSAQKISSSNVKTTLEGSSTLQDWKMTSTTGTFSGTVSGKTIKEVKYQMAAKTLKGSSTTMDDNAYKSMKADQFPDISFTATAVNIGKGKITGKLTITNVTKTVTFPINVTKTGNSYTINATNKIRLSDYGVTAPAFMMNSVKTGNDVTITVNITAK